MFQLNSKRNEIYNIIRDNPEHKHFFYELIYLMNNCIGNINHPDISRFSRRKLVIVKSIFEKILQRKGLSAL